MEDWTVPEVTGNEEYLHKLENDFEKLAEQQVKQVLDKMQHKHKMDVGGFVENLRIKYPKVWKKVQPEGDKTFSEIPITYNIKIRDHPRIKYSLNAPPHGDYSKSIVEISSYKANGNNKSKN